MIKNKTVYFCAGWFTDKQNKAYKEAMEAIKNNPTVDVENSYVPLQHQYKDYELMNTQNFWKTVNGAPLHIMGTVLVFKLLM